MEYGWLNNDWGGAAAIQHKKKKIRFHTMVMQDAFGETGKIEQQKNNYWFKDQDVL